MPLKRLLPWFAKRFDGLIDTPRWRSFYTLLETRCAHNEDFFFVQIGANDGLIHDPIHRYVVKHAWHGVLVEPVPYYFQRLTAGYQDCPNLHFENAAIADLDGLRDFYRIREGVEHLPRWTDGIGSFYREVILSHRWVIPDIADYIVTEPVRCLCFDSLMQKYRIGNIDLLLIDTEGYDDQVLRQIDLAVVAPRIIVFEHKHLNKAARDTSWRRLRANGYRVKRHFGNTMAYVDE